MPAARNIAFLASDTALSQDAKARLEARYGVFPPQEADVIVALGGDGFMLQTLHGTQALGVPVYGMNRGTVGFLMNAYTEDGLIDRLEAAEEAVINPLRMTAKTVEGKVVEALAINEVSLLRQTNQAARRATGRQAQDLRRWAAADGGIGLRWRAGLHPCRVDRL